MHAIAKITSWMFIEEKKTTVIFFDNYEIDYGNRSMEIVVWLTHFSFVALSDTDSLKTEPFADKTSVICSVPGVCGPGISYSSPPPALRCRAWPVAASWPSLCF